MSRRRLWQPRHGASEQEGSIVEAVLQRIDRTWSGRLEPLYKLSTLPNYLIIYLSVCNVGYCLVSLRLLILTN